jgi:hypothetical protein
MLMPKEKVGTSDSISIKKKSTDDKIEEEVKVSKDGEMLRTYFFPDEGKSIEADSLEKAKKKLKKNKK